MQTIEALFAFSEKTQSFRGKSHLIPSPRLKFSEALVREDASRICNVSFGVNHNQYPEFSVARMIGIICMENSLVLEEATPELYSFDLAPTETDRFRTDEAFLRGQDAGIFLHVEPSDDPRAAWKVEILNRGDETVALGAPSDGGIHHFYNPQMVWSVIPVDSGWARSHPSWRSREREIPGCGNDFVISYTGAVLEIAPGGSVDISEWVRLPWEKEAGEVSGKFRAALFFRNNPNLPLLRGIDCPSLSESTQALIEGKLKKTLDCLLVSNEIVFEATDWKVQWQKKLEERKKEQGLLKEVSSIQQDKAIPQEK